MVNQYSANRRNIGFCFNNQRNRLAATALEHNPQYSGYPQNIQSSNYRRRLVATALEHNLQYSGYPRNKQSSNYRRTRLSKINFKHNMTSQQRFNGWRITCQDGPWGSQRFNHYGGGRSRNEQHSQFNNGVLDEWNTNPNFAQTNFNNSNWNQNQNHDDIRQHNRNNNRNVHIVQQPNLNNNRNRQHKIPDSAQHDWNGNLHNSMEVDVSKDDEETEFDIKEAAGTPSNTHGNQNWCNEPLESNDSEEHLAESSQISSDGSPSPTYAHGNWKWRNVESNNDSEEDLDVNSESSDTICRQDTGITLQEESDSNIHDLQNLAQQTETEDESILLPDNTSDERTDNTPLFYVFRTVNPNNETYRSYACLPLDEGNCVAIGHQNKQRVASLINENLADDWIQDNAGEDENQAIAGLSEEAITKQLQTRIHSKYVNKGNWEADDLMDAVCVICQFHYEDADTLGSLQCGHEYHADCIRKWLVQKNNCPICKYTVLVEDEN